MTESKLKSHLLNSIYQKLLNKPSYPLHFACEQGSINTVKSLLGSSKDINFQDNHHYSPLHYAVIFNHFDIVQLLIEYGANINTTISNGETALHLAFHNNNNSNFLIPYLIHVGANINIQDNNGLTPLHLACQHGYTDITQLLIESGADFTIETSDGKSAFDLAQENNFLDIVTYFNDYQKNNTITFSKKMKP